MATILRNLMAPGLAVMRRLTIPTKLGLMAVVVFVPLLVLLAHSVRASLADLAYQSREIEGVEVAEQVHRVAAAVQSHRGLTNRVLHGEISVQASLSGVAKSLEAAVAELDRRVDGLQGFALRDAWQPTRQTVLGLTTQSRDGSADEVFARHTNQVKALGDLLLLTGERSGLLLDPLADTFFMMDIVLGRTLPLTEAMDIARGRGSALLTTGQATALQRARVLQQADAINHNAHETRLRIEALQRAGGVAPESFKQAHGAAKALAGKLALVFSNDTFTLASAAYFDEATQVLGLVSGFNADMSQQLSKALSARRSAAQTDLIGLVSICAIGMLALLYLAISFTANVLGALRQLSTGVDRVASGDLSHKFVIRGRDEFAHIGHQVEAMAEQLSTMVAEIRSSAVRVSGTGQVLAQGSKALAQRTEEQASNLGQIVATVGQLSQKVADSASKVQAVDGLTGELRTRAESGGAAMRDTVASLGELQTSSKRVSDIVSVIDGIAFQTNILALNAAVEAARAGEQGRGFAVVATEVRQLALRSGDAAKEIRGLITHSQEQVQGTALKVQATSEVLDALIGGVRDVSDTLRDIVEASASQSRGLAEMAAGVGCLDEITRQNAGMVDESARSSRDLVERASLLAGAVGSIRLRQGSADEADALAQRAMSLVQTQGLNAAMPALHSADQGFVDRDLYVFVLDRDGRYVLHGAKPAVEGKRVHDVPGIDGDRFVQDIFSARDGTWVEYSIVHPETGQVLPKASVIYRLNNELVLGCGVYRRRELARAPA
jgi:methyl-accepting chemotaxis protein